VVVRAVAVTVVSVGLLLLHPRRSVTRRMIQKASASLPLEPLNLAKADELQQEREADRDNTEMHWPRRRR